MYDSEKFRDFDKLIAESKAKDVNVVVVFAPLVLGDNYEEIMTNLDKLAAAELLLQVVPPKSREKPKRDPHRIDRMTTTLLRATG